MPSLEDRVVFASEAELPFLICIYGEPGCGKTTLACSLPDPLLIDIDRGQRVLRNHPNLLKTVKVFTPNSYQEVDDMFWEIKEGKYQDRKTIIIDTFTTLQFRNLLDHLAFMKKKDRNRNEFLPVGGDYQLNTNTLRSFIFKLRDLDRNVVIVCHEEEKKDGDNGPLMIRPAVTDKVGETLVSLTDAILYYYKEVDRADVTKRFLRTQAGKRIRAKSRLGFTQIIVPEPTAKHILDANLQRVDETAIPPVLKPVQATS
jgi:phage nucleotide-binding protein